MPRRGSVRRLRTRPGFTRGRSGGVISPPPRSASLDADVGFRSTARASSDPASSDLSDTTTTSTLALLDAIDVLHLSDDEAAALGLDLDERSLRTLGVPEIVVTLGSRGCVVYADEMAEFVPARPVVEADPTGAGDAFTTAYVASRLVGHSPISAARRATQLVHGLLSGKVAVP